ncbi:hypothetical protein ACJX0J_033545, partial [Zea mays]
MVRRDIFVYFYYYTCILNKKGDRSWENLFGLGFLLYIGLDEFFIYDLFRCATLFLDKSPFVMNGIIGVTLGIALVLIDPKTSLGNIGYPLMVCFSHYLRDWIYNKLEAS